jgi:hypothetical protein
MASNECPETQKMYRPEETWNMYWHTLFALLLCIYNWKYIFSTALDYCIGMEIWPHEWCSQYLLLPMMNWPWKGWVCDVMMVHKGWPRRKTFILQCTVQKHSSQVRSAWRTHNIYDLRDSFLFRSLTFCRNIISGCFLVSWDGTGNQQGLKENESRDELQCVQKPRFSTFVFHLLNNTVPPTQNEVWQYDW